MQSSNNDMIPEYINRITHWIFLNIKPVLYGGLLTATVFWILITKLIHREKPARGRQSSPDLEKPGSRGSSIFKAPVRPPGVWFPSDFKRPAAQPLLKWDVHKTEPLPYRPFKHGPYHITMGLRSLQWDDWIELDNDYLKYHADKARRIAERGEKCCRTAPEAMDGAIELLEELLAKSPMQSLLLTTSR